MITTVLLVEENCRLQAGDLLLTQFLFQECCVGDTDACLQKKKQGGKSVSMTK